MPAEQFAQPASELRKPSVDSLEVAASPTTGQGLALDLLGRVPLSTLPQHLTGQVAADGSIVAGTGFTITKGGAGVYTVNFTTPFKASPVFLATPVNGGVVSIEITALNASTGSVAIFTTNTSVYTDMIWNFLAWEMA